MLRQIAGEAGAKISRARTDDDGVNVAWLITALLQGVPRRAGSKIGCMFGETAMQRIGVCIENLVQWVKCEMSRVDAVVAKQNSLQNGTRTFVELCKLPGPSERGPALDLGGAIGWGGGA